jgi:hypothetical protein
MKKEEYKHYTSLDEWNGRTYGKTCFVCRKKDHYNLHGVEYRIERYLFHKRKINKNPVITKGSSRRIIICGDCWQDMAGEEYSMEW